MVFHSVWNQVILAIYKDIVSNIRYWLRYCGDTPSLTLLLFTLGTRAKKIKNKKVKKIENKKEKGKGETLFLPIFPFFQSYFSIFFINPHLALAPRVTSSMPLLLMYVSLPGQGGKVPKVHPLQILITAQTWANSYHASCPLV